MNGTDEFGGILVDDQQDEFGGVLVGEEPSQASAPVIEAKPIKKTGLLDVGIEEWLAGKFGLGPKPASSGTFVSPVSLPTGGMVSVGKPAGATGAEGRIPFAGSISRAAGEMPPTELPAFEPVSKIIGPKAAETIGASSLEALFK